MGLPRRACDDLRELAIDAVHLGALGLPRLPDAEAIELAIREQRVVVTLDGDFTRIVALSGLRVPSIVFLRQNVDRAKAVQLVRKVLAACEDALQRGCLVSVTEEQIRIRALPVEG